MASHFDSGTRNRGCRYSLFEADVMAGTNRPGKGQNVEINEHLPGNWHFTNIQTQTMTKHVSKSHMSGWNWVRPDEKMMPDVTVMFPDLALGQNKITNVDVFMRKCGGTPTLHIQYGICKINTAMYFPEITWTSMDAHIVNSYGRFSCLNADFSFWEQSAKREYILKWAHIHRIWMREGATLTGRHAPWSPSRSRGFEAVKWICFWHMFKNC
jgi:hypothetical protein